MPAPPIIRLEDVSKVYVTRHGNVHALEDVGLTVEAGQYVGYLWAERLRQVDTAVPDWRTRIADGRQYRCG